MTLESAAVEFLRAYAAVSKARLACRPFECTEASPAESGAGGRYTIPSIGTCRQEHVPKGEWCDQCAGREAKFHEYRAALKTYQQARRRAMRLLKKETP